VKDKRQLKVLADIAEIDLDEVQRNIQQEVRRYGLSVDL
jgi:hypothetical protein